MIVLVTSTKPVKCDSDYNIQYNSLRSACLSDCDAVINASGDFMSDRICENVGCVHVDIDPHRIKGRPSVSEIFKAGADFVSKESDLILFVNSDIMIGSKIKDVLHELNERFPVGWLAVCQRREVPSNTLMSDAEIIKVANDLGASVNGLSTALDFFAFPKSVYRQLRIPDSFLIGKPGWDNWLVGAARKSNIPVVDISKVYPIRHATHPVSHVKGDWVTLFSIWKKHGFLSFCDLRDVTHRMFEGSNTSQFLGTGNNTRVILPFWRGSLRGSLFGRTLMATIRLVYSFVFRR